jgi:hypothetical protein
VPVGATGRLPFAAPLGEKETSDIRAVLNEVELLKFIITSEAFRLIHVKASDINLTDSVRIPKKTDIVKIYLTGKGWN